jgi:hypothetical protein
VLREIVVVVALRRTSPNNFACREWGSNPQAACAAADFKSAAFTISPPRQISYFGRLLGSRFRVQLIERESMAKKKAATPEKARQRFLDAASSGSSIVPSDRSHHAAIVSRPDRAPSDDAMARVRSRPDATEESDPCRGNSL